MPNRKHHHAAGAVSGKTATQPAEPFKFVFTQRNITVSDDQLIADLRRVARKLRTKQLTVEIYKRHGKYDHHTIYLRFTGWVNAMNKAGLKAGRATNFSEVDFFQNLERVWLALGHQPSRRELYLPPSRIGPGSYDNRFGGINNAMRAFIKWKAENPGSTLTAGGTMATPRADEARRRNQTGRNVNARLRYLILKRDNFKCQSCGRSPANQPGVMLQIDHIKPWSAGGETVEQNLRTLCHLCNVGKSNL
jgi:hypothetical protein